MQYTALKKFLPATRHKNFSSKFIFPLIQEGEGSGRLEFAGIFRYLITESLHISPCRRIS